MMIDYRFDKANRERKKSKPQRKYRVSPAFDEGLWLVLSPNNQEICQCWSKYAARKIAKALNRMG